MVEVTPYFSPCGKQEDPKKKKLHLRINKPATYTTKEMANDLAHSTTLTEAEIAGALTAMRHYILKAFTEGRSVRLDGIGRFSAIPYFIKPVYGNEKFRNKDIGTKGVQFLVDSDFMKEIRHETHYHAGSLHRVKSVGLDEAIAFCEKWFEEHDVLITTDMMHVMQINRTKAQRLLIALVDSNLLSMKKYGQVKQYMKR